jgi:transcriptional regulator with XRE-family HTH domain
MKVNIKAAIHYYHRDLKRKNLMTMKSLAEDIGVSRKTLYNMENGKNKKVDYTIVDRISKRTDYPICKLIKQ